MICPNCQKEVPDTARACGYCGHWLASANQEIPIVEGAKDDLTTRKNAKNDLPWFWISVGGMVLVIIVGTLGYSIDGSSGSTNAEGTLVAVAATATEQTRAVTTTLITEPTIIPSSTAMPVLSTNTSQPIATPDSPNLAVGDKAEVIVSGAPLYRYPDTSVPSISALAIGARVELLARNEDKTWVEVWATVNNAPARGWIQVDKLKLNVALNELKVREVAKVTPATPQPTPSSSLASAISTPAPVAWTDEFEGALAPGWSWSNEDSSHWNLTDIPGSLRIITQGESLYFGARPSNLLLRDAPFNDFEITTKVAFDPLNNFQQAAIVIYQDEDNFVLLNRGYCDPEGCPGDGIFLDSEQKGLCQYGPCNSYGKFNYTGPKVAVLLQLTYLKLQRVGTTYIGFYSSDGQTWTELGRVENPMAPSKVGLTANNSSSDLGVPQIPADYDFFTVIER